MRVSVAAPGRLLAVLAPVLLASAGRVAAVPQLQVSPGPLSRAHAKLEGIASCAKCHDAGRTLSAERCLACHKPIAERIAGRKGVHRAVAGNCAKCHVEHRGADADPRRLDRQTFDHTAETGFVLDGRHARVASKCEACHKTRSFLAARTTCESCHADVHKGALGRDCAKCHRTTVEFKQTRAGFDHATARFALTGAHRDVACEKCHVNKVFRGLAFDDCAPCHKFAHRHTMARTCATCHVTDRWAAAAPGFDHVKTGFVLAGLHAQVTCAKCHTAGVRTALAHDRCAACHANPHRESIKDDCGKCHDESGFKKAKFDHAKSTGFPLTGKHDGLECRKCHKALSTSEVPAARRLVDFSGEKRDCATCHKDEHKGEFGRYCESCHQPTTFKVAAFVHPRSPEFFAGAHKGLACAKCHVRPAEALGAKAGAEAGATPPPQPGRAAPPSLVCASCHADVHFGQVGPACEKCHAVDAPKFQPARFSHDTVAFKLAGKHATAPCLKCHPSQTAAFPSGTGTAKRLRPVDAECRTCHQDPHLGQVEGSCARCHAPSTFKLTTFNHVGLENLMSVATHSRIPCKSCHKTVTGQFPAGPGTAMRFKVGRTCLECHP
jgi:hypothetical protein